MPRRPRFIVVLGASLLASAFAAGPALAARTVNVDLTDQNGMAVKLSTDTVHAGKVTFRVTDDSNNVKREFLVADLNTSLNNVPYSETQGRVKESKLDTRNNRL